MLSVIIPTYSASEELAQMALELCKRAKEECDELIVTEDYQYHKDLADIADIYILHPNLGFTKNVNLGLRIAHGDYMAVVNSDIKVVEGNLRRLCKGNYITSPECIEAPNHDYFYGGFFVLPRKVLDEFGYLDERFPHWHSDAHYGEKVGRHNFLKIDAVKVSHPPGKGKSYTYRERVQGENI